ncbi:MAG: hypothetical protein ACHQIO_10025, partial [Nevskiales bacterium]
LPNIPTIAEAALPDYAADIWLGLLASAAMPADALASVDAAMRNAAEALAPPLIALGLSLSAATGVDFAGAIERNRRHWAGVLALCGYDIGQV